MNAIHMTVFYIGFSLNPAVNLCDFGVKVHELINFDVCDFLWRDFFFLWRHTQFLITETYNKSSFIVMLFLLFKYFNIHVTLNILLFLTVQTDISFIFCWSIDSNESKRFLKWIYLKFIIFTDIFSKLLSHMQINWNVRLFCMFEFITIYFACKINWDQLWFLKKKMHIHFQTK